MAKPVPRQVWTDKKRTFLGLPWSFTRYILTEKKLITRKGFLNIVEDEVELYRILDKSLRLPFGQRLFGCGTVILNCKDVDTPVKEIKSIKKPRQFMEILEKYVDDQRDKYGTRGRDIMGMQPHDHSDALCDADHE
ncbi:MAG: PH domain-containing protein [Oscillospiraceae bacterium]|nr:PH domain-containing protein [Oscillospiraceae bacterium]